MKKELNEADRPKHVPPNRKHALATLIILKRKQQRNDKTIQLQVKMSRVGGKILELKKVYKSYGELVILKGLDYTFRKGERIGIIGKNGVGKSIF